MISNHAEIDIVVCLANLTIFRKWPVEEQPKSRWKKFARGTGRPLQGKEAKSQGEAWQVTENEKTTKEVNVQGHNNQKSQVEGEEVTCGK